MEAQNWVKSIFFQHWERRWLPGAFRDAVERAVGLVLHTQGSSSRTRSCQWSSGWKTPCLEQGILGLRVLLFPKPSFLHTAHLVCSRTLRSSVSAQMQK